ncbi:hypothetical protein ACP4OV_019218 [Aristida adscensionis]
MKVARSEPVRVHAAAGVAAAADEFYFLSNLDQNVAGLMKTVHVFTSPERCTDDAAALIRDALGRVLPHYHPFEGRLVVRDDGRLAVRTGRDDRRGVPFVEAAADCYLRDVVDASAPDDGEVDRLAELVYADAESEEAAALDTPLLTVQVTRFRCGGFVLGLAMNHCLADGQSAAEFLRSWAEAARGAPLSAPPRIDRGVLRARPVPTIAFPHEEFAEIEDVSGLAGEPCVRRSFAFDAGKLERLKRAASEGSATPPCSTFVALTAFVWAARTRALRMLPEQRSKLLFAVDVRRRIYPPLPRGFWGNAVVFACCVASAGDLLGGPLSAAARAVGDAVARVGDAFVRSAVDYVELHRGARPSLTATTLVTSWRRLGFRAADFGWGEAAWSGPAEVPRDVVMLLRGARDPDGTVLLLGLPRSCMQDFQEMVDLL